MKETELMLMDLVMYQGAPAIVGCLSDYDIKVDLFRKGEDVPCAELWDGDLDEIEPIQLTGGMLEACGFKHQKSDFYDGYYFCNDNFCELHVHEFNDGMWQVEYDNIEMGGIPTMSVNICYVHELQHFLQICGVEMEIKI